MYRCLGGVSAVNTSNKAIFDTSNTHGMDLNYRSLFFFQPSSSAEYVTLGNEAKYLTVGHGTKLVWWEKNFTEKQNLFHVPGLSPTPVIAAPEP